MRTRARWRRIVSFACTCLHVVISQLCVKIQETRWRSWPCPLAKCLSRPRSDTQKKCIFSNQRFTHADAEVCAFPQTDFINKLVWLAVYWLCLGCWFLCLKPSSLTTQVPFCTLEWRAHWCITGLAPYLQPASSQESVCLTEQTDYYQKYSCWLSSTWWLQILTFYFYDFILRFRVEYEHFSV